MPELIPEQEPVSFPIDLVCDAENLIIPLSVRKAADHLLEVSYPAAKWSVK